MRVAQQPSRLNLHSKKVYNFNTRFFLHNDVLFFHCFSILKSEHGATEFDVAITHLKVNTSDYYYSLGRPSHYGHGFTNSNGRLPFRIAL
jgi:hypothetical protein